MWWSILGIVLAIAFSVQAVQDANNFQQKKYWVMLVLYVLFGIGILAQGAYMILGIAGVIIVGIAHQFMRKADANPAPSPQERPGIDLSKLGSGEAASGFQSRPSPQASQAAAAQADVNNLLFSPQNSPQFNQLLALSVPVADDPAQAVVGKWTIEDGKIGNIGVTVEIFPDNTCRFSNNATGTWEIKEGNKMIIAAQPFAAFSLTPHENLMNGGWMEIKGDQGIMSSVILKRVGAPVSTGTVQQIATLYGAANKPAALIFSDGTIKNIKGQVLGHVDPQGEVYAASSRYWGRVAGNGDFFQRAGKDSEMHMGNVSAKGDITTAAGKPWGRVVLANNVTTSYSLPILGGGAMILNLLAQVMGSPDKM
jgi:hypothetical protein